MIGKTNVAGENLTEEMTAQETLIDDIKTALVGKVQGANATADKILAGYKAYVGRQLVEGTYEPLTGVDFGEITLSADSETVNVNHSLGVIPKFVILIPDTGQAYNSSYTWFILQAKEALLSSNVDQYGWYSGNGTVAYFSTANKYAETTANKITFKSYSSSIKFKAIKYYWLALA